MVTLNLTLIVQLVLFLVFLWGMHRLAFRPTLEALDARDEQIARDEDAAAAATKEAAKLEGRYAEELAAARQEAAAMISEVRREAVDERNARLAEARREADEAVAAARAAAQQELAGERAHYDELLPGLLGEMRRKMSLGGSD